MKIGIDISQIAYEGTGVAKLLAKLVENLLKADRDNEYILFFSSLRKQIQSSKFKVQSYSPKLKIKKLWMPPTLLDILWNHLHILPIEWLIGEVDIFVTSDWTEPPTTHAKKATILYDLIVYKTPHETDSKIVLVQKRKLMWVKKESDIIFCISEATKKDAMKILGIEEKRLRVIYPGI